jgi:hypothetical protein
VVYAVHDNEVTPDAAQGLRALVRLGRVSITCRLEARWVLEAQPSGTLALRTDGLVCRALEDTGTAAPFALSTGSGM